jgi:hypothetical protein
MAGDSYAFEQALPDWPATAFYAFPGPYYL